MSKSNKKRGKFNDYSKVTLIMHINQTHPESSLAEVWSSSSEECYICRAFSLDKDASGRDIIWALGQKSEIKGIDYFKVDWDSERFNRVGSKGYNGFILGRGCFSKIPIKLLKNARLMNCKVVGEHN